MSIFFTQSKHKMKSKPFFFTLLLGWFPSLLKVAKLQIRNTEIVRLDWFLLTREDESRLDEVGGLTIVLFEIRILIWHDLLNTWYWSLSSAKVNNPSYYIWINAFNWYILLFRQEVCFSVIASSSYNATLKSRKKREGSSWGWLLVI